MLEREQLVRLHRQVPLLHIVAIFNTLIVISVAARDGIGAPLLTLLALVPFYNLTRLVIWLRRRTSEVDPATVTARLHDATRAVIVGIGLVSALCVYTYLGGFLSEPVLIPISMAFGMFCVAHSMSVLPRAAILALVIGIVPSAVAMLLSRDFAASVVAVSAISVGLLQFRFIHDQHWQMIDMLCLQLRIRDLADTDALTGLPNRRAFMQLLDANIGEADAPGAFGVAMIDLDGFKAVNDRLGHFAGDELLVAAAGRISAACGEGDCVARLGGDEFVILLRDSDSASVARCGAAILAALAAPFDAGGRLASVSASIGYAGYEPGLSASQLLMRSDSALYAAKAAGKGRLTMWTHADPAGNVDSADLAA